MSTSVSGVDRDLRGRCSNKVFLLGGIDELFSAGGDGDISIWLELSSKREEGC